VSFPARRPRRLRATPALRALVRETTLAPDDLVQPLFAVEARGVRREIPSLPGQHHVSADDTIADAASAVQRAGAAGVLLFGLPDHKDAVGSGAYAEDGVVQRAVRTIKAATPDLLVIVDVCLDEYTDHGHCGVLDDRGRVDNDATLPLLARTATSLARAGADVVAPSDMMDGRVGAIRHALDEDGRSDVPICSYAAKYASAFYGPFREAVASTLEGDRRAYQMDPANGAESLREVALDLDEGADLILVKPALPYLDVVRRVRERFDVPTGAYMVSGEYAMLEAAAARNVLDRRAAILESLLSVRRAGADFVITYHATEVAGWL
jgi:porphobilinogen synthase